MEKIKLSFPEVEKVELEFNGQRFIVNKYASPSDECAIANFAVQTSESDDEIGEDSLPDIEKLSKFEYGFIGGVLHTMTNIDIQDINIDSVVASGLWQKVKSSILNYHDLFAFVEKVSKDRKENLESKLNKMVDSVGGFIDNISKMDWSAENLKSMVEQIGIGKEELGKIYPVVQSDAKTEKPKKTKVAKEKPSKSTDVTS